MLELNETTTKTFSDLPPHWSLSVRFDVIAINANKWSTSYLKIYLDSVLQATYTYQNNYFWKICSNADNLILYNKNLTTHTKTSITVSINAEVMSLINLLAYQLVQLDMSRKIQLTTA